VAPARCLYGTGWGAHTQHEVGSAQARRAESGKHGGNIQIGDFLYVKWRDKASGKEHEDRDLLNRLPPLIRGHWRGGGAIGLVVAAHTP
jgi:hypothetical protein